MFAKRPKAKARSEISQQSEGAHRVPSARPRMRASKVLQAVTHSLPGLGLLASGVAVAVVIGGLFRMSALVIGVISRIILANIDPGS